MRPCDVKPHKVVKVTCIDCGGDDRNHDVLREIEIPWEEEEEEEDGGGEEGVNTFQICRCRGCETVRFRVESWDTLILDKDDEPKIFSRIFPEASSSDRLPI